MTTARWQRIKLILGDALACDPAIRASFVAQACQGDARLQSEVDLLLAQDAQVIDDFAADTRIAMQTDSDSRLIGQRLGTYEVLSEIGRGGMGAVYLAARADGHFDKKVAIKLLKRGTDTDEVLRRFHAERQILARLDHPNLARLLDAGTTDDGLPYFVMEYVLGIPINQYVAEHELLVPQRLKLFQAVCSAVSYAHQNLVIHRDIKPSNVLVTAEGEVKLLDFGIAKLVQPSDSEEASVTVTILRVMTPEYASPEQVKGEAVTTVSDVYSLGMLLYELLTGNRPYKLKGRTGDQITKAICEQEPERPSAAVTQATRTNDREKVRRQLRGDLDNIVLKALRKDPSRRYGSVDQLASDIRRHLEGLPVGARKDTTAYRVSKFIQRHKLGVAAAATVTLALIGGIAATAWEAKQARKQREISEERFRDVRELAHSVLFDYHDQIATLPGSTPVRERLVKDSLKYLDRLAQKAGNDLSLQEELAIAYLKVGDVQGRPATANLGNAKGALESYSKALIISDKIFALAPKNTEVLYVVASNHERLGEIKTLSGNPANAVEHYRHSLAIFEELSADDPSETRYWAALAITNRMLGQVLGVPAVANIGDTKGALFHLQTAATITEALPDHDSSAAKKHSDDLFAPSSISKKYKQENLAYLYDELGTMLDVIGNKQEAMENRQKSVALYETLLLEDPRNISLRRNLAVESGNIGNAFLTAGNRDKALTGHRQALALYEALVTEDPNNLNARKDLALGYRNIGKALENNDRASASSYYHKALDILEDLVSKDQGNAFLRRHLAYTYLRISMLLSDSDDLGGAAPYARKAISICENLVATDPNNSTARNTLALSYSQLGRSYSLSAVKAGVISQQKADWLDAKSWYQKSLNIWEDLKAKGTLNSADAGKPDEVAREIANCDSALNSIRGEKVP